MAREQGVSVRVKLTLSYAGFLVVAVVLLLAVVWVFILRYVPAEAVNTIGGFVPGRDDLVRAFAPAAAWVVLFLVLFGLLGGWILAGRMLAPLTRITTATRAAANGSLAHRIRMPGRNDEFRELADAFDAMLERVEAQVGEQRRFAANASHELRTPLATTQAMLDVAINDPHRDTSALLERLRNVNARAIELTEALLLLSRAEQRSFTAETVDLSLLVEEAGETLLPLAEKRGITVTTTGEITRVSGSPALLAQLTTNLLHNAIVHNLPDGGDVWVRTARDGADAVLTVENPGATLSPAQVSILTEPFQRGSERIRTDDVGVGLGLAIASSIIRAHDGVLLLTPRADGGLRVDVRLPASVDESVRPAEVERPPAE
ncbi:histidine kinase [Leifsonia sp. Root1293]|nr:histidine kinase [Leifsonia sp. Root1293]KRA12780.1 histidine kinase [Leifsonia sp. Root60]